MQIDEGTYKRLPAHLQALFERLPNPSSDEVLAGFPQTGGGAFKGANARTRNNGLGLGTTETRGGASNAPDCYGDSGSAARFFYCAKASKRDRDEGLDGMPEGQYSHDGRHTPIENPYQRNNSIARNPHPTVKPTALMRYLVRLVTPPGGIVLDPFMGSGSTGKAAALEGFSFVGIELDAEYLEIARRRIEHAQMQPTLDGLG
jgi:site-specific DNA-methyltransferase (adenine-specific)